eukprot:11067296-Lingulodinium_polyedra.AAC.1
MNFARPVNFGANRGWQFKFQNTCCFNDQKLLLGLGGAVLNPNLDWLVVGSNVAFSNQLTE